MCTTLLLEYSLSIMPCAMFRVQIALEAVEERFKSLREEPVIEAVLKSLEVRDWPKHDAESLRTFVWQQAD